MQNNKAKHIYNKVHVIGEEHDLPVITTSKYWSQKKLWLTSAMLDPQRKFMTTFV